jgi:hypothetical protein
MFVCMTRAMKGDEDECLLSLSSFGALAVNVGRERLRAFL